MPVVDARTADVPGEMPGPTAVAPPGATRIAVVLASAGRPECLAEAILSCRAQSGVTFHGVLSVPDEASLPADRRLLEGWSVVTGSRGLTAQRNAGLDALDDDVEIVAFFDDDSAVRHDYLQHAAAFLDAHPAVVGLTGRLLADGVRRGGISADDAREALEVSTAMRPCGRWSPTRQLYGCNFVVRAALARELRFDERLPLYSWLEDHDFARRLLAAGDLAEVVDCVIVHRGASSGGRSHHLRFGYSQVMNPVYLLRKGTFPWWQLAHHLLRPVPRNLVCTVTGPDRPSRRERLKGNAIAARDVLRGRITPERITEL